MHRESLNREKVLELFGVNNNEVVGLDPFIFRLEDYPKGKVLEATVRDAQYSGYTMLVTLIKDTTDILFSVSQRGMPDFPNPTHDRYLVINSKLLPECEHDLQGMKKIMAIIFLSHIDNPLMGDETVIQMIESIAHQLSQSEVVV